MSADQHPFVAWVRENHGKDASPLGDFASEIAPELPATGTRAELRERLYYNFDNWVLDVFDAAWELWEASASPKPDEHPFALWLTEHHGEADTPLGHFARTLSPDFPVSGERVDLRRFLKYNDADEYMLTCFAVAWEQYAPTCSYARCPEPAAHKSLLCELHGLL